MGQRRPSIKPKKNHPWTMKPKADKLKKDSNEPEEWRLIEWGSEEHKRIWGEGE